MTQGPAPLRIVPTEIAAESSGGRIHRILGRSTAHQRVSALVDLETCQGDPFTAIWLDATTATTVFKSAGTTAVHILWTSSRLPHTIEAGYDACDPAGLRMVDVTPGDTITIPPGAPFRVGEGILAFLLGTAAIAPEASTLQPGPMPLPPVHGLSRFHRYNRQTICSATPALVLERWKLTHPIQVSLETDRLHYLANLVTPVVLNWPGGSDLLGRIRSRLLPPGLDTITLVPDGLGYILLAYVPDLSRDVVAPLLGAGYDPDSIAALGVPIDYLK